MIDIDTAIRSLTSALVARSKFASQSGLTFYNSAGVAQRNMYVTLGYKEKLTWADYWSRYKRGGISRRLLGLFPRAAYRGGVYVEDTPEPGNNSSFEKDFSVVAHKLIPALRQAEIWSLIGEYAVVLIGVSGTPTIGELSSPLASGLQGPGSVLFFTPYTQNNATYDDSKLVSDLQSPRWGRPELYTLDMSMGSASHGGVNLSAVKVHHSRVIHVPGYGALPGSLKGDPFLESTWNRLDDLDKIVGGGAESAWVNSLARTMYDLDPEAELSPTTEEALRDEIEEFVHNMKTSMLTQGVTPHRLVSQVNAFGSNANTILREIVGTYGIPLRIAIGSERGELASTQDRNNFNDRVGEWREEKSEPLLRDVIDHLVSIGILSSPINSEYDIRWSPIDELTETEKAELAGSLAEANKKQVEAGGGLLITSNEIRDDILDREPLEGTEQPTTTSLRHFNIADNPQHADHQTILNVADNVIDDLQLSILSRWTLPIDLSTVEDLLTANQPSTVVDMLNSMLDDVESDFTDDLMHILSSAGYAAAQTANDRGTLIANLKKPLLTLADEFVFVFDAANEQAIEWANNRSSQLITEITPDTRLAVQHIVTQGHTYGIPPARLAKLIKASVGLRTDQVTALFNLRERLLAAEPGHRVRAGVGSSGQDIYLTIPKGGISDAYLAKQMEKYAVRLRNQRARLIARTETLHAANEGQRQLWLQSRSNGQLPANIEREWLPTPDERTRDTHAAMTGQRQPIDRPFESPDGRLIEPGEEPNCRCGQRLVATTT